MNGESGGMVNGGVEDFSVGEGAELTNLIPVMGGLGGIWAERS